MTSKIPGPEIICADLCQDIVIDGHLFSFVLSQRIKTRNGAWK